VIEPLGGIHQNRATKLHNINVILFQNLAGGKNGKKNVNRRIKLRQKQNYSTAVGEINYT